ncbi:hypothetical protein LB507_011582 [Fusarium sp. FIESC RH6]|nr:hypothetical protein LB507_011582 [Fusarium sp. FIESC RH6]
MAPSEFNLLLQKGNYYMCTANSTKLIVPGIAGGFAPPTPEKLVKIAASPGAGDDKLIISVANRTPDSLDLAAPVQKTVAIADHQAAIDELQDILKDLPTEFPPGSEDIYHLDTSIAWMSEDLEWYNGGPQGCGGGQSQVKATEENKQNFKRAVEIIEEITGET